MIGTAKAVATRPLNKIPAFMKNPRREIVFSFGIVKLLVLCVIRSGIRLSGVLRAPRGKPGNDVSNFLVRHGLTRHVCAPVGGPQFGTARDDNRAKPLIADQREKGIVREGTSLWSSAAARPMAGLAVDSVAGFA